MTDPIKAKIQELVPEVMEPNCSLHGRFEERYCSACGIEKDITLAVVLRAIEKADVGLRVELSTYGDKLLMGQYEKPEQQGYYCHAYWNLSKDNLDDQSEEFKRFLGKLLGV